MNKSFFQKFRGEIALFGSTIIWGGTFPIIKESLHDISPYFFVALRFTFAAILFLPIAYNQLKKVTWKAAIAGTVLGISMYLGFITQTIGLKYTTATKSAFLTGTAVVIIPFWQYFIIGRKPTKGTIIGIISVFIGIIFLSSGNKSVWDVFNQIGSDFNIGDMFTLASAFFFTVYVINVDIQSRKYHYKLLSFFQFAVTAVAAFIVTFGMDAFGFEEITLNLSNKLITGLTYTVLLATLGSMVLLTVFQKYVSPARAGIIYSFEPVFASVFAYFMLDEIITETGYLGAGFIFTGLIISEAYDYIGKKNGKEKHQC